MRTMLISMTESTSWPSFEVAMGNIGAYNLFMFSPIRRLSCIQSFHNELWGLYGTKLLGVVEMVLCESFRLEVGNLVEQERLPYFSLTFGLAGIQNVHYEPYGF
ncbi:predicted protein [Lichtheimia corymbifera JMRC:FSU:9682]|uniref:Uncharacterized protein n=1 Tax=Lichtheimia corymbifera JMRC:FSU:9682 TaxID=1263082 RepID=A0A068RYU2_9FUNG|nr:predicted protein [Lichtheimia corymbifera JMRC:FSU:9682]